MNRVIALFVIASLAAGCAPFCQPESSGTACETTPSVTNNYYEDDSNEGLMTGLLIGAVVVTALAIIVAKSGGDNDKPAYQPPPVAAQPAVYVVTSPDASDEDMLLQRMFVQGLISARAGRCEATISIEKNLATTNPSYHAKYVADPTIATCFRTRLIPAS